jgi:Kdo2-lipid IVA lauroyltransferase/acyltransferase
MAAGARKGDRRAGTRRWQRFVLWILSTYGRRLEKMPRAKAMRFAERFGSFLYRLSRRIFRRPHNYARRNLRLTEFPRSGMTLAEQDAFIYRVFIQFSKSLVDFLRGPSLTLEELDRIVHADGFEHVREAQAADRGIIFVTAHLGNWEMLGRWLSAKGVPLTVVAREPEDPAFAAYVHQMRENAGFSVAYRGSGVRELLSLLKAKKALGLLPDQNSGDLFIPFFGIPAGTVAGPASLALHTGAVLLPCYCVRQENDMYRLLVLPPISTHSTGDRNADTVRIMTEVNHALESVIRKYPDQWLWLHNRWKSAFDDHNRERSFPGGVPDKLLRLWQGEA